MISAALLLSYTGVIMGVNRINAAIRFGASSWQALAALKQRDAHVRNHEAQHLAAAGIHAKGGPVFEYQDGPDGNRYAVGGHVEVDTSVPSDPKEAAAKGKILKEAALAPSDPSGADKDVAALGNKMIAMAGDQSGNPSRVPSAPQFQSYGGCNCAAHASTFWALA